jgi:uncharacterized membrane protein YphA (DoxX/SURF4 family)
MNIGLWIVQCILCVLFLGAGGMKVFAYPKYKESVGRELSLSKGLVTFIGISELAGALGLILPMASGIVPILTPLAAAGLAIIMLLATGFHVQRKEPAYMTVVLLILSAFVAWGRGLS